MTAFARRLQRSQLTASSASGSAGLFGWELTSNNIGLAGVGINKNSLPTYTGPSAVPRGTTISNMKITVPLDLYNGDITIDKCWIVPSSFGSPVSALVSTIRVVNNENTQSAVGNNIIRDCDIDGSGFPLTIELAQSCGFAGIATMQRNYIHGIGSGLAIIVTGGELSGLFENNYITGLRGFGNPATTGSHNEAATIRDFPKNAGNTRSVHLSNNRFDCQTAQNDTGSLFLQPLWGDIWNVWVEGNYLEGGGYNLYVENNANVYGNIYSTNNRFRPTGYGASAVASGGGWAEWSNNFMYSSSATDAKGSVVNP